MKKAQIIGALTKLKLDDLAKAENAYSKLLQYYLDGEVGLAELNAEDVANVERLIAKTIKVKSEDVRLLDGADGFGLEVYGEYNRFDIMEYLDDNVINQVAALWRHWEDGATLLAQQEANEKFWRAYEDNEDKGE